MYMLGRNLARLISGVISSSRLGNGERVSIHEGSVNESDPLINNSSQAFSDTQNETNGQKFYRAFKSFFWVLFAPIVSTGLSVAATVAYHKWMKSGILGKGSDMQVLPSPEDAIKSPKGIAEWREDISRGGPDSYISFYKKVFSNVKYIGGFLRLKDSLSFLDAWLGKSVIFTAPILSIFSVSVLVGLFDVYLRDKIRGNKCLRSRVNCEDSVNNGLDIRNQQKWFEKLFYMIEKNGNTIAVKQSWFVWFLLNTGLLTGFTRSIVLDSISMCASQLTQSFKGISGDYTFDEILRNFVVTKNSNQTVINDNWRNYILGTTDDILSKQTRTYPAYNILDFISVPAGADMSMSGKSQQKIGMRFLQPVVKNIKDYSVVFFVTSVVWHISESLALWAMYDLDYYIRNSVMQKRYQKIYDRLNGSVNDSDVNDIRMDNMPIQVGENTSLLFEVSDTEIVSTSVDGYGAIPTNILTEKILCDDDEVGSEKTISEEEKGPLSSDQENESFVKNFDMGGRSLLKLPGDGSSDPKNDPVKIERRQDSYPLHGADRTMLGGDDDEDECNNVNKAIKGNNSSDSKNVLEMETSDDDKKSFNDIGLDVQKGRSQKRVGVVENLLVERQEEYSYDAKTVDVAIKTLDEKDEIGEEDIDRFFVEMVARRQSKKKGSDKKGSDDDVVGTYNPVDSEEMGVKLSDKQSSEIIEQPENLLTDNRLKSDKKYEQATAPLPLVGKCLTNLNLPKNLDERNKLYEDFRKLRSQPENKNVTDEVKLKRNELAHQIERLMQVHKLFAYNYVDATLVHGEVIGGQQKIDLQQIFKKIKIDFSDSDAKKMKSNCISLSWSISDLCLAFIKHAVDAQSLVSADKWIDVILKNSDKLLSFVSPGGMEKQNFWLTAPSQDFVKLHADIVIGGQSKLSDINDAASIAKPMVVLMQALVKEYQILDEKCASLFKIDSFDESCDSLSESFESSSQVKNDL